MNDMPDNSAKNGVKSPVLSYAGIIFVIIIWGFYPLLTADLLEHYSGGVFNLFGAAVSAVALTLICIPKLRLLDKSYFRVAVPTGLSVAVGNLLQKIGLQYTTPTYFAFLENLSCVAVPLLLFLFIKRKPGFLTLSAGAICLGACFILSGAGAGGFSFGKGEILCALAGITYGFNIAATGAFAKKLNALLYVMIQMWVNTAASAVTVLALDRITVGGEPLERAVFSPDWRHLAAAAAVVLGISTFGWLIRTESQKRVNASVVAVMMPFSSLVTGVASVVAGSDVFSPRLAIGGALIILSSVLSGIGDSADAARAQKEEQEKKE